MNKKEFKELDREQMIIAFNQLKDDYSSLFAELEQEKEKNIFLEGFKVGAEETIKELKEKNTELRIQINARQRQKEHDIKKKYEMMAKKELEEN